MAKTPRLPVILVGFFVANISDGVGKLPGSDNNPVLETSDLRMNHFRITSQDASKLTAIM